MITLGHGLKFFQVWSRSLHGDRFCICAKYNTLWQANLFYFVRFLRSRAGRIVRPIFTRNGSKYALGEPLRPSGRALERPTPQFPKIFTPKTSIFGDRPMCFQWGAFRAVVNTLIDRIPRLIAQTTQFGEFFHDCRAKMLHSFEIPQIYTQISPNWPSCIYNGKSLYNGT